MTVNPTYTHLDRDISITVPRLPYQPLPKEIYSGPYEFQQTLQPQNILKATVQANMLLFSGTKIPTLNKALTHPKVHVWNADAYNWVRTDTARYDLIVMDFPDPSNYSVGKLYSTAFYRELPRLLRPGGRMVVQSTSPFMGRRSFWCIVHTLQAVGFQTQPYHAYVPSFGEWGYVLVYPAAGNVPAEPFARAAGTLPTGLRYVNNQTLGEMGNFPPDMAELPTDVNRLNNQVLVRYFEEDWGKWQ